MKRLLVLLLLACPLAAQYVFVIDAYREEAAAATSVTWCSPAYELDTNYSDSAGGSDALSIPSDCDTIVVVCIGVWVDGVSSNFTYLEFDDATPDENTFTYVQGNSHTDYTVDSFVYVITATDAGWPGTGSHTLYWTYNNTISEGGAIATLYFKDADQDDPIQASTRQSTGTSFSRTMGQVQTGDMSVLVLSDEYTRTIDATPSGSGQTELLSTGVLDNMIGKIAYEIDETSLLGTSSAGNYTSYVAFAVTPSYTPPEDANPGWTDLVAWYDIASSGAANLTGNSIIDPGDLDLTVGGGTPSYTGGYMSSTTANAAYLTEIASGDNLRTWFGTASTEDCTWGIRFRPTGAASLSFPLRMFSQDVAFQWGKTGVNTSVIYVMDYQWNIGMSFDDNVWIVVIGRYDYDAGGSVAYAWVDDAPASTPSATGQTWGNSTGVMQTPRGAAGNYDYDIDWVCFYERLLTDEECAWLYNGGATREVDELTPP